MTGGLDDLGAAVVLMRRVAVVALPAVERPAVALWPALIVRIAVYLLYR